MSGEGKGEARGRCVSLFSFTGSCSGLQCKTKDNSLLNGVIILLRCGIEILLDERAAKGGRARDRDLPLPRLGGRLQRYK